MQVGVGRRGVVDRAIWVEPQDDAARVVEGARVLSLQVLVLPTHFVQVVLARHLACGIKKDVAITKTIT